MTDNNKLYGLVEAGDTTELSTELQDITAKDFANLIKWQNPDDNNNTILHTAIAEANTDVISLILQTVRSLSLANDQIAEALNTQNTAGANPIAKILQIDEDEQAAALENLANLLDDVNIKKSVFLSYGDNKETLLHVLSQEEGDYSSKLLSKILEIAKTNIFLQELLTATNVQSNTPVQLAALEGDKEFLNKTLAEAQSVGVLSSVFNVKGENKNTVLHYAFGNTKPEIAKLVVGYIATLKNPESYLSAENTAGKAIDALFKNSEFINIFKGVDVNVKAMLLDSIVTNILTEDELESVDVESDDVDIPVKIAALYEEVKSDDTLKAKFLDAVNLDTTKYNVADFFQGDLIKAKLGSIEQAQRSLPDVITPTVLESALTKIESYKTNFFTNLPENFGDSVREVVKVKLSAVSNNATEDINTAAEEGLNQAYTDAKAKIEEYSSVYAKDGFDGLKDSANQDLQNAVRTKATEFVNTVCTVSYTQTQKAKDCISKISSLKTEYAFLQDTFKAQESAALEYIEQHSTLSKDDAQKGLNSAFSYVKDLVVIKDIERYISQSDMEAKKVWALNTQARMTLTSGIDATEAYGVNRVSGYNNVYSKDRVFKIAKKDGTLTKKAGKFVDNTGEEAYKSSINANAQKSMQEACSKLKVEGDCNNANILNTVKAQVCPAAQQTSYEVVDTNAVKFFCNDSIAELDSLAYNTLDFLFSAE